MREEGTACQTGEPLCIEAGRFLAHSGTGKKLNIDGLWGWKGEEKRLQKLDDEGHGVSR